MRTHSEVEPETKTDASLVELSLAGDREAFGQIVIRYQSAICALAYSACGSVARSEDVAQEIFIAAWRKLGSLREPEKFRAWLYGIARNLIHNTFRQQSRNPLAGSAALDEADGPLPADHEPDEQAISKEEETILWHVLSGLPEAYREPMILFYRKNESVREVAEILDISEDAVRQRLLRGRAILNERVTRVIQNGLRRSRPTDTFALAVVAALPLVAATTTAKGAVVGLAASKSAGPAGGLAGAAKAVGFFAGLVAIPAALGGLFGYQMGRDDAGPPQQRDAVRKFWKIFGAGLALFLLLPLLLTFAVTGLLKGDSRAHFLSLMTTWLGLAYPLVLVALIVWFWQRRRATPSTAAAGLPCPQGAAPTGKSSRRFVWITTVAAAALLIFSFSDMGRKFQHLSAPELRQVITETAPADLKPSIVVEHYRSLFHESPETFRSFWVEVRQNGHRLWYYSPMDETNLMLLNQKGVSCPTYVAGRDYEILGTPGRLLPLLAAFVAAIGIIYLFKRKRQVAAAA